MRRYRIFLANVGYRRPMYPLVTPPMGLLYLAAHLRAHFPADIRIVNQRLDNIPDNALVQEIAAFEPDVVGLGGLTPGLANMRNVGRGVRRALPGALLLLGGPHVASFGAQVLDEVPADAAVPGEGELSFEAAMRAHFEGGSLADVPGIFRRTRDGEVVANPGPLPVVADLDTLPFPAYDLIDLPAYWRHQSMPPIPRRRYVSLVSSRGCPYQCSYCHCIFGKRYRRHSAERIVEEIAYYRDRYGVRDVEFLDDIFNLDHDRLLSFCDLAVRREPGLRIAFPNGVRADILTGEEITALARAGMYFCSFALESGSARIQKLMGKNLDIPRFTENVRLAAAQGVFTNGFAMLGFPGETAAEMQATIDVACASRLHTASFFTVTPFPNTRLHTVAMRSHPERLRAVNYVDMDYSSLAINVSDESDATLFHYQRKANRRFFLDPARALRILRDFPQRHLLPFYGPIFLRRLGKGLLRAGARRLPVAQGSAVPEKAL